MASSALTESKRDTELHVLGCMLLDPRTIAGISDILAYDDFTSHDIAIAYQTALDLWAAGHALTPAIVAADLPKESAAAVWEAYEGIGSAASSMWYAGKIKEAATRRDIIARCKQITTMAQGDKRDIGDIVSAAQTSMYSIASKEIATTITEDMVEVMRMSEQAAASKYGMVGVPTGFPTLDNLTGGFNKQDLVIIAARPSVGKTAFGVNILQNIVENTDDIKAIFFSGEMSRYRILNRMASRRCQIDNNALARGNLRPDEWTKYTTAGGELSQLMEGRVWIDDKSRPSPGHIRSITKQRQQISGIDIIFCDYLQIMSMPGRHESRVSELSALTSSMKAIAKDLDIPVVLLSQVTRGAENREEMLEPCLGDLKGSGSIEEDADTVMFPHRATREAMRGKLIIAKQRNGPTSMIPLSFHGPTTTFKEM